MALPNPASPDLYSGRVGPLLTWNSPRGDWR